MYDYVEPIPTDHFNLALARKTLTHLIEHPEQHQQGEWWNPNAAGCGTAGCVAGWAVHLDGYQHVETDDAAVWVGGEITAISDVAESALGLTSEQADYLFDGGRGAREARNYLGQLIDNAMARERAAQKQAAWTARETVSV